MSEPERLADNSSKGAPSQPTPSSETPSALPPSLPSPEDRAQLLARARAFLVAPEIRSQHPQAKRVFLADKGLTDNEIDILLRELPPPVPPRAYPPPPPSALPTLLIGLSRVLTWLTGGSAIILLIYHRYLLPRLTHSYHARHALHSHARTLLARLAPSAAALQASQATSYAGLPRAAPQEHRERAPFSGFETLDDILEHVQRSAEPTPPHSPAPSPSSSTSSVPLPGDEAVPDLTTLRCALHEVMRTRTDTTGNAGNDGVSTEALFAHLERRLPWLSSEHEHGAERQAELWRFLTTCPLFTSSPPPPPAGPSSTETGTGGSQQSTHHPSRLLWKYTALPPRPTPFLESLTQLRRALPTKPTPSSFAGPNTNDSIKDAQTALAATLSPRQRTLQVLSDFTGYITTQIYSFAPPLAASSYYAFSARGGTTGNEESVQEDELRREIRALKGLVLNRRSFLPPTNESAAARAGLGGDLVMPLSEPSLTPGG